MRRHYFRLRCLPGFTADELREALAARLEEGAGEVRLGLYGLTEVVVIAPDDLEVGELLAWTLADLTLAPEGSEEDEP